LKGEKTMKKLLIMLMVVAVTSFLFVGCLPGTTTPDTTTDTTTPTTVAPIITAVTDIDVTSSATQYVNKAEAVDGITVTGTAPTHSEVKVYINGITAGTGDAGVNGVFSVVVANADLIKAVKVDGAKTLYATATDHGLAESAHSNEKTFILDTVAPFIEAVKARGGTAAVVSVTITLQTFPAVAPNPAMFTAAVWGGGAQLPTGTTLWKVEMLSIIGLTPEVVTVRVHNLSDGTFIDYGFNDSNVNAITSSIAWIPGANVIVNDPLQSGNGLDSTLHVGAYALITTVRAGVTPGRISLTYNENVTWTQATTAN